ncbi:MAG TPA: hypothetical protein VGM51_17215 [Armatimonadota bacterium]|jgi:hypothetical protein
MKRSALILLALLCFAVPASARRHRRVVRHRTSHRRIVRRGASRRPGLKPIPTPAIQPVRNIALFVAYGYDGADWATVRAARPDGYTAWDRMPVTGVALPTGTGPWLSDAIGTMLATGIEGSAESLPPTLAGRAKQAGKSVALVGAGDVTAALPAFLAVAARSESGTQTLGRLAANRFDALFARSAPSDLNPSIDTLGYRVLVDPQAILMAETMPVLATASAGAVPFDTLAFRAIHLAAKNARGFVLLVGATKPDIGPVEFSAAATVALNYARKDKRTLVLIALCEPQGDCLLYADGMSARKFGGTLMLTDVPKILAGVAAIKGMPRNFSALYFPRLAPQSPAPHGRGIVPLPW